jgi:acetylornithine deacetylase
MTIGKVDGGTAGNILARAAPSSGIAVAGEAAQGDAIESALPRRRRRSSMRTSSNARRRAASPSHAARDTPGLAIDRDSEAETLARALTGDNETRAVAYAAEAGLFQRAGHARHHLRPRLD